MSAPVPQSVILDGRIAANDWLSLADDAALPAAGKVIVSLKRFRAEREALESSGLAVGVRIPNTEDVASLAQELATQPLIAVEIPKMADGRAYSQARALLASLREDLSKIVVTGAYKKAAAALDRHGFVLLIGEPAAGKTTIASLLAMAAIDQWNAENEARLREKWQVKTDLRRQRADSNKPRGKTPQWRFNKKNGKRVRGAKAGGID